MRLVAVSEVVMAYARASHKRNYGKPVNMRFGPLKIIPAMLLLAVVPHAAADAIDGIPEPERYGYPCLYSPAVVQSIAHCVVGYYSGNGVLLQGDITHERLPEVAYYRVLDGGDAHGWREISSYWPDGKQRSTSIRVYMPANLLAQSDLQAMRATGRQTSWHRNGQKSADVGYHQGRYSGSHINWNEAGIRTFEGQYVDGKLNQRSRSFYDDGQVKSDMFYSDGRLEGPALTYYPDGQLQVRASYRAGQRMGLYETWHANGRRESRGTYIQDRGTGLYETWYDNGRRASRISRDGFVWLEELVYYPSGKRASRMPYVDDKKHGQAWTWYENGRPSGMYTYVAGKKEGPYTFWRFDGTLKSEGVMENGVSVGRVRDYEPDGKRYVDFIMRDGKVISVDDQGL